MTKKILVVYGHPAKDSYNKELAKKYMDGALASGAQVEFIAVRDLEFAISLKESYLGRDIALEPDLKKAQELITWANHLVFVYPTFWSMMPALLKGFVERTFTPGFAYKFVAGSPLPQKLLKGKSARIITTMDAPPIFYNFILKKPGDHMFKQGTLQFCGVKPVRVTHVGSVKKASEQKKQKWLEQVYKLGAKLK